MCSVVPNVLTKCTKFRSRRWRRRIIFTPAKCVCIHCAGIFKQSMGARNRVGIGLSYRPARLHSLADLFPLIDSLKIRAVASQWSSSNRFLRYVLRTCEALESFESTWSFDPSRIFDPTGDLCRAGNSRVYHFRSPLNISSLINPEGPGKFRVSVGLWTSQRFKSAMFSPSPLWELYTCTEPVFVNLLRSQVWRDGTTNLFDVLARQAT
jgi:hypothetical protein